MPSSYTTLSRYSDDLETLFLALVTNVNADEELGKLRSTMARLHRKPGEQIQVALYKLKSYCELLLGISFPQLDSETATIRADNYSANSSKYFVSSNTATVINRYIGYKIQKGEAVNVMGVCQVIAAHENTTTSDAIQTVMYLPEIATRLDTQMSSAKNVEELVITSTNFERGRGVSPKQNGTNYKNDRSGYRSPGGTNYKQRGRSANRAGFRSPGGTNYKHRGRSANTSGFQSPGGTNYTPRGRSANRSGFRSPGGTSYRPRSSSAGRYQSPGGRKYQRSPGGSMWRKSPGPGNRGPPQQQQPQHCVRCGDPHPSGDCPHYAYYRGPPCSECNLQHATSSHKKRRSNSYNRTKQQASSIVQQHQTEIVQTEVPNDNLGNYFETKN